MAKHTVIHQRHTTNKFIAYIIGRSGGVLHTRHKCNQWFEQLQLHTLLSVSEERHSHPLPEVLAIHLRELEQPRFFRARDVCSSRRQCLRHIQIKARHFVVSDAPQELQTTGDALQNTYSFVQWLVESPT